MVAKIPDPVIDALKWRLGRTDDEIDLNAFSKLNVEFGREAGENNGRKRETYVYQTGSMMTFEIKYDPEEGKVLSIS